MRQKEKEITNTREIETIIQKAEVCRLGRRSKTGHDQAKQ
jgi:nitroimidazol reductase NimA-like FMN-containing flavoprotein (pyridoxamine 5'-phosphate oxidase superfamily)